MSFTCQQCGKTTAQLLNYCPRCGAPTPTIALAAAPLVPQETEFDPLDTWEPTKQIALIQAREIEFDPLDTWEPTKHLAFLAATEALPSAPMAILQAPRVKKETPSSVQARVTASSGTPALTINRGRLIAALTLGLLLIVADGGDCFTRRAKALAVTAAIPVAPPSAELQPLTAVPVPTLRVEEPVALPASTPIPNNTIGHAKPVRRVKVESKANAIVVPTPTPNTDTVTKSPAATVVPEKPVVAENNHTAPNPVLLIEQGNRLANSDKLQDAIQVYEKARRTNPGNVDVYYLLGSAYHRSGELTKALEAYRQCTSGNYAAVAANHVKKLGKKQRKTQQDD